MDTIKIKTSKKNQMVDITFDVKEIVKKSKVKEGICVVYCPHTTSAITINENADPNIMKDIIKCINNIVPEHNGYLHDKIDNNAAAHIKSTIIGANQSIPISNGNLQFGKWQNIFFTEWDGPRQREIWIKIIGE